MKWTVSFIVFFSCLLTFAEVQFNPTKQIVLQAKTCEEIEPLAQSILNWTQTLSSQEQLNRPECYCSSNQCVMDVAPISPYFVRELTNFEGDWTTSSAYNGPNCFNAALVSTNTLPKIRFTHPAEMTAFLSSSLCEERALTSSLKPGDLLIVRDQKNPFFEIHAAIFIDERLSFSKYGEVSPMPYAYGLDVAQAYGVQDKACLRVQGIPAPGEHCYQKPFVNFFSCKPFYSYMSDLVKSSEGLHPLLQNLYAKTSSLEIQVSNIAFKDAKVNREILLDLQNEIRTVSQNGQSFQKDQKFNVQNKELLKLLRVQIFSLFEQTRRIAQGLGEDDLIQSEIPLPYKDFKY